MFIDARSCQINYKFIQIIFVFFNKKQSIKASSLSIDELIETKNQ